MISGTDAVPFLQGLVTNQMLTLGINRGMYSAFLNAKGRILYDAFIYRLADSSFIVEGDNDNLGKLKGHLKKYVLRSKVSISDSNLAIWQAWPSKEQEREQAFKALETHDHSGIAIRDPRHKDMGFRFILANDQVRTKY